MPNALDPMELVNKLAETYRGVKFGRGVVGKTSHATLAVFGLWAIILIRLSDNMLLDLILVAAGLVTTAVYGWWVRKTQQFAAENPGLAMLEGAEFIEYQKWEAEVKGLPLGRAATIVDPRTGHALLNAESQGS